MVCMLLVRSWASGSNFLSSLILGTWLAGSAGLVIRLLERYLLSRDRYDVHHLIGNYCRGSRV